MSEIEPEETKLTPLEEFRLIKASDLSEPASSHSLEEMRGFLRGMNVRIERDEDRL